jgi:hypothetical protein
LHTPALAQSTGGVTGPKVAPGDQAVEYRISYDPSRERFAQRIHYQRAVSANWRLRAILFHDYSDGDFRFQNVTLQAHYQFQRAKRGWNSGLQLQGVIPSQGRGPGLARIAMANSLDIAGGGELRMALYAAREIGDNAAPGLKLETRAEASFPVSGRVRLGVQSFNDWGSTAGFGPISGQSHRIGPLARFALPHGFFAEASVQLPLTDGAPEPVYRLFVGRSF